MAPTALSGLHQMVQGNVSAAPSVEENQPAASAETDRVTRSEQARGRPAKAPRHDPPGASGTPRRVVIREELLSATGCPRLAMILDFLIGRQAQAIGIDPALSPRPTRIGEGGVHENWFRLTAKELTEGSLLNRHPGHVRRLIKSLANKGFIEVAPRSAVIPGRGTLYRVDLAKIEQIASESVNPSSQKLTYPISPPSVDRLVVRYWCPDRSQMVPFEVGRG
jgi:hypothetical protein